MNRKFASVGWLFEGTSNVEKRCVFDVIRDSPSEMDARSKMSRAFAICRSSLQKSGRLKQGTAELTKSGGKRSSAMGRRADNKTKIAGFERMVKKVRI